MQGMENILSDEMCKLGMEKPLVLKRAVKGWADLRTIYNINYCSYFSLRVLVILHEDNVCNEQQLYKSAYNIAWEKYVDLCQSISVQSSVQSKYFRHSQYVALKVKDAIVDRIRNTKGKRPDVDPRNADIPINVHIFENRLTISLDSSGDSLHKRAYRIEKVRAPLNEVLAAGMVKLSQWNYDHIFWDPMCGSGTLVIEAILQKLNKAPQEKNREFAFKKWPNFDNKIWDKVLADAANNINKCDSFVAMASDIDHRAIETTKYNLAEAGLSEHCRIKQMQFSDFQNDNNNYHIIMNPPYDERLKHNSVEELYKSIGSTLKKQLNGSTAWILSSNLAAIHQIGLRPSRKIKLMNGALESLFLQYKMYSGTKKRHKSGD